MKPTQSQIDSVIGLEFGDSAAAPGFNVALNSLQPLRGAAGDLFAQLPESRVRGYKPGRYSFNVKGGRCEACQGDGLIKIDMPGINVNIDLSKLNQTLRNMMNTRKR